MKKYTLGVEQVECFNLDGVLVIKDFYDARDVLAVQLGIYNIIGRVLERHDLPDQRKPFSAECFDDGFDFIIQRDRSPGSEIMDAAFEL